MAVVKKEGKFMTTNGASNSWSIISDLVVSTTINFGWK